MQRFDGARGPVLIEEPEPDTEGHDSEDNQGVGPLSDNQRRGRGRHKQYQQGALNLAEQHIQGSRTVAADGVGANFAEAVLCLSRTQPSLRTLQSGDDGRRVEPGRRREF